MKAGPLLGLRGLKGQPTKMSIGRVKVQMVVQLVLGMVVPGGVPYCRFMELATKGPLQEKQNVVYTVNTSYI